MPPETRTYSTAPPGLTATPRAAGNPNTDGGSLGTSTPPGPIVYWRTLP